MNLRPLSDNARGAVWMLGSALCFTLMAALLKLLAQHGFAESQMVFFRAAAGLAVLAPVALFGGAKAWAVKRPIQVLWRCIFSTLGFFASFYAFAHLPLAQAQALSFTRTLFVVGLAALLLREQVGWRRWGAVGVGFLGVLIMTRPDGASFSLASLMAVLAALFFGLAIVTVKDLTRDHSTLTLVLWTNGFTTIAGAPFALLGWLQPGWQDFLLLVLLGLFGVGAQSCYVRALATGDASLLGLMDYVRLPLAMILGFICFAERPDAATLIGAAIVIGSTLHITWRESLRAAGKAPAIE